MSIRAIAALGTLLGAVTAAAGTDDCAPSSHRDVLYKTPDIAAAHLPAEDYLAAMIGCNAAAFGPGHLAPPPRSSWQSSETELYTKALARKPADVLVAPFQVQGFGLDRTERSLMADDLSYALASKYRVADPVLAARALGEGDRRIDEAAIRDLAARLKARKIIEPFVGHDENFAMTLSIRVLDVEPGTTRITRESQKDWRAVKFSDEKPPFEVFHSMLADVIRSLDLQSRRGVGPSSSPSSSDDLAIGPVAQLPRSKLAPSRRLLLLAALTSSRAELPRERLFERAYEASLYDGSADDGNFVRAYALFGLNHRPAALALLGTASNPSAIALRTLLNGDLPAARKAIDPIRQPFERLLIAIGVEDLRRAYGSSMGVDAGPLFSLFGASRKEWEPLLTLKMADREEWEVPGPEVIKALLDRSFPLAGVDLSSITAGFDRENESAGLVAVDVANARHIRRLSGVFVPSDAEGWKVTSWDVLWLLENLADARMLKELERMGDLQGRYRDAISLLDGYEAYFSGNPDLAAVRAWADARLAAKAPDDERRSWTEQAAHSGLSAAVGAPGQNLTAYFGLSAFGVKESLAEGVFWDAYARDFPPRDFWYTAPISSPASARTAWKKMVLHRLAYDRDNVDQYSFALQRLGSESDKQQILDDLRSRFVGAPGIDDLLASLKPAKDAAADKEAELRARISASPARWSNYRELGLELIKRNRDYAGAAKVFESYPGFRSAPAPEDRVALSNSAFEAGNVFYLRGEMDLSRPFLQISADLHTGSAAGLASQARLRMLSGDLPGAMVLILQRAQQYQDVYAWRDYLSYLHVIGRGAEAWRGFAQLESQLQTPRAWDSALVGHRVAGDSEAAVRAWLMKPENQDAAFRGVQFAPWFALMWNSIDRTPPDDLGQFVRDLSGPPIRYMMEDGNYARLPEVTGERDSLEVVAPSVLLRGRTHRLPPGTLVQSDIVYFTDGYLQLRRGNWQGAVDAFRSMEERYEIESGLDSFVLPYLAMAASKTGDRIQLEESIQPPWNMAPMTFERALAKAILTAARGDLIAATGALNVAFDERPVSNYEPISTEYQYAEVCEWIFQETKNGRFEQALLKWLRMEQLIHPMSGWAYAMEFAHTASGSEHTRALAMALYLDRNSDRLKGVPESEKKTAREWLGKHNPFIEGRDAAPAELQRTTASRR